MKHLLLGTPDSSSSPETISALITALLEADLLYLLATSIHLIPFEARKDTQFIFSNALRYRAPGTDEPVVVNYMLHSRPQVVTALCNGYEVRESAMPCGGILREALKVDAVAALILYEEEGREGGLASVDTSVASSGGGVFWKFFGWIVNSSFEVTADAFSTFRVKCSLMVLAGSADGIGNSDQAQESDLDVSDDQL